MMRYLLAVLSVLLPLIPATASPAEATDLQWWGTAKAEINRMLKDTGRTAKDIEQPKWVEPEYSTLGRMPLVDTALANALIMPEIAMYFDEQCKKNADGLLGLFTTAEEMADQAVHKVIPPVQDSHPPTEEEAAISKEIEDNKDIPKEAKYALSLILDSSVRANWSIDRAFKNLSDGERSLIAKLLPQYYLNEKDGKISVSAYTVEDTGDRVELIWLLQKIDWGEFLQAARIMADAADKARAMLAKAAFGPAKNKPDILFDKETSIGRIIIGNTGNNVYTEDAAIIIDLGGDDRYLNNAGGTRPGKFNVAMVIDAGGNDTYQSEDFCQGCGYLGVGMLVDIKGNDVYTARNFSQATALGGFGFLYDGAGDDTYTADFGGQSCAIFGYSILSERAGNDSYKCNMLGQAGSSTMGVAIMVESAGNDTYQGGGKYGFYGDTDSAAVQGSAIGMRPWPPQGKFTLYGGIALLSDAAGDDKYSTQAFGQGGSYLFALGMCVDSAGNDFYSGTDYCQGSGCHLGAAVMIDRSGNDVYTATNHSTGGSLDRAAGVLLDIRGNDSYNSGDGVGYAGKPRGCGIFVDCTGDDKYLNGVYGKARPPYAENIQSSTFFLDMGGKDSYHQPQFGDNKSWQQGEWGMSRDWDAVPVNTKDNEWKLMAAITVRDPLRAIVEGYDKVMDKEDSRNTFERFSVFDDIINAGDKAVDIVVALDGTWWNPFTLKDLIDITETLRLKGLIKEGDNPKLCRLLLSNNEDIRLIGVVYFFRSITSQAKVDKVVTDALSERALKDDSADIRGFAVMALGRTGDAELLPVIEKVLQNKDWVVRRRAVMALGYIKDKKAWDILAELFKTEKAYQVRAQVVAVMGRSGLPEAIPYLKKALQPNKGVYEHEFVRYYCARSMALGFKDKSGIDEMIGLLDADNWIIAEEITGILKELTGQNIGQDKAKWQAWWMANRDKFEFKK
ncbi:MAG: HEAT repeat domain-containing protein [Planctomycetota bacterium]